MVSLLFEFLFLLWIVGGAVEAQDECLPRKCGDSGPSIRFPFWIKGQQPDYCGYPHPGFELSCSPNNTIFLNLQFPVPLSAPNRSIVFPLRVKLKVLEIFYELQQIRVSYTSGDCLPVPDQLLTQIDFSSASPFTVVQRLYTDAFTLFNCSSKDDKISQTYSVYGKVIPCLSGHGYQIYAFGSNYNTSSLSPLCVVMYNVVDIPWAVYNRGEEEDDDLQWAQPPCGHCETKGKHCRLKNNTKYLIECFDIAGQPKGSPKALIISVVIGTLFLTIAIFIVSYYTLIRKKKKEDQKRIEKFLDDYNALLPTRFSYADIKKITDKFKEKLGEGGYGTVVKGKLSNDILVAVKVLKNFNENGEEFTNEVGTIGTIHHINVVRLVGYCADGHKRALLYEFLPNDSLKELISSRHRMISLGWKKIQQIAIGIAKGLDYLHHGCNQRILHFDIKPQNILLDHNFNPKVADFGLAKLCSKDQSAISMTVARGTIGYIAPEVFSKNFGNVSYKADVYSFGTLLLDMAGGRKKFEEAKEEEGSQIYYPEWIYKQLESGKEIEVQIDKEDSRIVKKLAIVGLWCIQWYPADRPSIKVAIQMLEGKDMPAMPPNPLAAAKSTKLIAFTSGSSSPSHSEICSISEIT